MNCSRSVCAALRLAALTLVAPSLAVASVSFSNHTQPSDQDFSGGVAQYQHADLNGDGHEDLIWQYDPVMGGYNTFVVQLSVAGANGNATYGPAKGYSLPNDETNIYSLVVGDLNHDGIADVGVFANDGYFHVYLNDGKGNLTPGKTYAFGNDYVQGVLGDFNHDGILDLAYLFENKIYIWWGTSAGGFTSGPTEQVPASNTGASSSIMLGDFDGDGKADLFVSGAFGGGEGYVFYGDNTGHFPVMYTLTVPASETTQFSVGDVNSDAKSDILYTQSDIAPSRVSVAYGDATREFASRTSILTGRCVSSAATVADLDGNGLNDIIVGEVDCGQISGGTHYIDVLLRNANASYQPDQTVFWAQPSPDDGIIYEIPYAPQVIRGNLDAAPDLLVTQCVDNECAGYQTTVQSNTTGASFPTCAAPDATGIAICAPTATAGTPVSVAIGASGTTPMRDVEVWIDGVKEAEGYRSFSNYVFFNGSLNLSAGKHQMDIYAAGWDQWLEKKSITLTVE